MTVTRANAKAFCCDCAELVDLVAAAVSAVAAVPAVVGFAPLSREPASEAAGEDGWPRSFFSPDGKEAPLILLATDARLSMYSYYRATSCAVNKKGSWCYYLFKQNKHGH